MYEFIRGPLAWSCFVIFIGGTVFQISRFFILSDKKQRPAFCPDNLVQNKNKNRTPGEKLAFFLARIRVSVLGTHPIMLGVTLLFHVCIVILPLFLLEHHILLGVLWGASFCPYVLPHFVADVLFLIILMCIVIFVFRRIFVARVRAITTISDYYLLALSAAPFATGYLAVHNVFDYNTLVILHILSVELLLVSLPFTKLVHMIYFFLNRIWIRSEYDFGGAMREW